MLSLAHRDSIQVVLVSPRNPLNIGAAARAMANFGFAHLTVVTPYEPHWREAKSAVGAEDLLQSARKVDSLADAVAGCTLVLGTGTLTSRKPRQPAVALPALAPIVSEELARSGRIALVFGSEKHGLSAAGLSLCHHIVHIPTHPDQPSMNLAQAVAVCLYELATHLAASPPGTALGAPGPSHLETQETTMAAPGSPSADLERLADLIDQVMLAARYSPASMREANRRDLRILLRRLALTRLDTRRTLGFFRRVLHRLRG